MKGQNNYRTRFPSVDGLEPQELVAMAASTAGRLDGDSKVGRQGTTLQFRKRLGDLENKSLEVLLTFVGEYWEENRHIEEQRVAISNIIIIVASAAIGLVAQKEIAISRLPLAFLITFAGLYGMAATAKLYERHWFLQTRLDLFYTKIDSLVPDATFEELRAEALEKHKQRFGILSRLPVNRLWMAMHAVLVVLGIVLILQNC